MQVSRWSRARVGMVASLTGLALVVSGCGDDGDDSSSSGDSDKKLVYFMAPNTTPTRYIQQDGPGFEEAIKALDPDVEVEFVNAGGSSDT
jgi:D-xylose transport system substrate-binding protein